MAQSSKPGPGTVYFEAGSPEHTADLIAAQQRARDMNQAPGETAKSFVPWILGGLALAGVVYFVTRD